MFLTKLAALLRRTSLGEHGPFDEQHDDPRLTGSLAFNFTSYLLSCGEEGNGEKSSGGSIGRVPTRRFLLFARNPRLPITFVLDHIQLPIFASLRSPVFIRRCFSGLLHESAISSISVAELRNRICIHRCEPPLLLLDSLCSAISTAADFTECVIKSSRAVERKSPA